MANKDYIFLFDLDGTIVLTDDIYYSVWSSILYEYNITLTENIFKEYIQGNNDEYVLNTLLQNLNINLTELSQTKDKKFIENIEKIKVVKGVYELFEDIKSNGYKCSIVTNCNKCVANKIVEHISIDKYIDFIISNNDVKNAKPNSEPYISAITRYNGKNNDCIIFEDSKSGLLSAKSVNPKILIGIETIYNNKELINYGANITLKDFTEFNLDKILLIKNNCYDNFKKNIIQINSFPVKNINIYDNKLKGGFIADILKLTIKTEFDEYNCILKYENTNDSSLSFMAKKIDLYEREYYFYEEISKYINVRIPKYYGLVKENENNIGMILENLFMTSNNFKINLNLNQESIETSLLIVNNMAKMHSLFWNKDLKKLFPKLNKTTDEIFNPFLKNFISQKINLFKNKWRNIISCKNIERCDRILNEFTNIQERLAGKNTTFIHGDIKSPNIFYDMNNNGEPYFIDWQHCGIGKGVQDLIFFIIESFDINNIKLFYPILKNYYYKKIMEYGVKNYSFDEFELDIKDALCYVPYFTAIWFGSTDNDELIDKNFPFFFIQKLFYMCDIIGI
jgi:beta-phosphoglucomutase-like phosphatase (HAD superfamily)